MVSQILNNLCLMADKAYQNGQDGRKKVIDDCISEIHKIYSKFENRKRQLDRGEFVKKCACETRYDAPSVKGLVCYTDGEVYRYEIDKFGFDKPEEVIDYLIKAYQLDFVRAKSSGRIEGLEQVYRALGRMHLPTEQKNEIMTTLKDNIRRYEDYSFKAFKEDRYE